MTHFPSLLEDHVSQIPALQLLLKLGYVYLRPQEVFLERRGKQSNVLLEGILEKQLRKLNRITYKGRLYEFSDANIQEAIRVLKDATLADGLILANEKVYDLISLGKSLEQTIGADTKSFTLNYIDWNNPDNNVYHAAEEFEVEQSGGQRTRRPDIVLFVNGVPLAVIECKRPDEEASLNQAISQQLSNQSGDKIPKLFIYSQLLIAVNKNEARFATTGTPKEFWSRWRERSDTTNEVSRLINKPLATDQKEKLFADRFAYVRRYFDELEMEEPPVTEQDKAIYSLCRPERLIELTRQFIVFDAGAKKIARYHQYFAVKNAMARIKRAGVDVKRAGGVVWHTQGSGKSLTMVLLARAIASEPSISDPRIVLATDRVDPDDQVWKTFHHCGKAVVHARTGKRLLEMLSRNEKSLIITARDKFETAVRTQGYQIASNNIFTLVDENHHNLYVEAQARIQKLLPNACYIGFTGTPIKKSEKEIAIKPGCLIDAYPVDQAVKDRVVTPLLYERRSIEAGKDRRIYLTALDISDHFSKNIEKPFKAQLTVDSKLSALKFKRRLDELGQVSSEVLISGPDALEGDEMPDHAGEKEVQMFWKQMMEKYGDEKEYDRALINAFRRGDKPEIMIVVDKLLTGFDVPRNAVLYIARGLKGRALLQAIARVNRLCPGKDFGYIVDYHGTLDGLSEFDESDLRSALTDIGEETAKLPRRHSELWDVFKVIGNSQDVEAFEQLLADEVLRNGFYSRLSAFSRSMSVAFSSAGFIDQTPEDSIGRYKRDLVDFQKLRLSVKRRYAEEIEFDEYNAKVQKLIDAQITSNEILRAAPLASIFDREKFRAEVDRLPTAASKADTIAHRAKKTAAERMEEEPIFYRRFSKTLEEVIQAWRNKRISDAEYLGRAIEISDSIVNRAGEELPEELQNHYAAKAFYGVVNEVLIRWKDVLPNVGLASTRAALKINRIIQENKVVDWVSNQDAQNQMKNQIEDYLYALKEVYGIDLKPDDMDFILDKSVEIAKAM